MMGLKFFVIVERKVQHRLPGAIKTQVGDFMDVIFSINITIFIGWMIRSREE